MLAIRPLLGPLSLAFLYAYLLLPLVEFFQRRLRISRRTAVVAAYFSVLLLLAGVTSSLVPLIIRLLRALPTFLTTFAADIEELLATPVILFGRTFEADQLWQQYTELSPLSLAGATDNALQLLETTSLSLVWLLIILVTSFYLLLDWPRLITWLIGLSPPDERAEMIELMRRVNTVWRAYLRGMGRLILIISLIYTVLLSLVGLPAAIALGVLSGLLITIPEFGPFISALIAILVALVRGSEFLPLPNFWFAILVAAIYLIVTQVRIIWLQPRVMGGYLRLNTGLIFVALVGAILIQGTLAAFFIVPLLATLALLGQYVRAKLLKLPPFPEPLPAPRRRARRVSPQPGATRPRPG